MTLGYIEARVCVAAIFGLRGLIVIKSNLKNYRRIKKIQKKFSWKKIRWKNLLKNQKKLIEKIVEKSIICCTQQHMIYIYSATYTLRNFSRKMKNEK